MPTKQSTEDGRSKPVKVPLECEHEVWLRHPPAFGDIILCRKCGDYRTVGIKELRAGVVVHPEGFITERKSRGYRSLCAYEGGKCSQNFTVETGTFYKQRDKIESHILRDHLHSRFVSTLEIKVVSLPPNSPPPF